MSQFTLLSTVEYYDHLLKAVEKAKHTINLASLDLIYDTKTKTLFDAVESAQKRGVRVSISADTLTFNELMGRSIGPITPTHKSSQETRDFASRIRREGGDFTWLGRMLVLNSYKGRNHEKWSVIDDDIFCFGGINLYDAGLANTDFMLHLKDASTARLLREEHQKIIESQYSYPGISHQIDEKSFLYIDSAEPYGSAVYRRACDISKDAVSALYVSQFYPTGELGANLEKISTTYYTNRPEQMANRLTKFFMLFDKFRSKIENQYTRKSYLHAKFIIFTMEDGSKIVITGSHNFSFAGVRFGTIEVALETRDESVISQIESFTKQHVA